MLACKCKIKPNNSLFLTDGTWHLFGSLGMGLSGIIIWDHLGSSGMIWWHVGQLGLCFVSDPGFHVGLYRGSVQGLWKNI